MSHILTLDVGTTAVKTCVFDKALQLKGHSNIEYRLITAPGDIVEMEAEVYWDAAKQGIREARAAAGVEKEDILAVAVTTQGETLIPVDKGGRALRRAIVWLDGRAEEESRDIHEKISIEQFYRKTGIPECTGLTPLSKLLWIKNHEPDVYTETYKFLLLEDYILLRLTGKFVTEKSLMCSTGYFDLCADTLWAEMLHLAGLDADKIPEIKDCGVVIGGVTREAAMETGLAEKTSVATAAMDQVAAAVGAGNIRPGMVTETTGTALVTVATGERLDFEANPNLSIYRHAFPGSYLYLTIDMTAGMALKWFKDEFCADISEQAGQSGESVYARLDEMAESIPAGSGGLICLPYFTGMIQPDNNPRAKGVFFGVELETGRAHFIRAILESVAYMLKESILLLETAIHKEISEVNSMGGGSKSMLWNQIKADVTQKSINLLPEPEMASKGAAILAAMAIGIFDALENAAGTQEPAERFFPAKENEEIYKNGYQKYVDIYERLKELF